MDLKRLKYFSGVAAEGSLGRASRLLNVAQPALSRQIHLLERDLGVALFERTATGMRLTEEGRFLQEAITHPFQQIQDALEIVRHYSTKIEAGCTIGLPPSLTRLFGRRLIDLVSAKLPNMNLRLVEADPMVLVLQLRRGTVDLAILPGFLPEERHFSAEIATEPLLLVVPGGSELAGRRAISFAELDGHPLILPRRPAALTTMLEKLAVRIGIKLSVVREVDSLAITKDLVRAGTGFTLLEPVAFMEEVERGELIGIPVTDPELKQSIHFVSQEHWRIPRSIANIFYEILFGEWMGFVDGGEWPSTWVFDRDELTRLFA